MIDDRYIRNFSERKDMSPDKHCKLCKKRLPRYTVHFSNEKAVSLGYCSFICMLGDLKDKAYPMLSDKNRENRQ